MPWIILFVLICFLAWGSIPEGSPMGMLAGVILAMSLLMFVVQGLF